MFVVDKTFLKCRYFQVLKNEIQLRRKYKLFINKMKVIEAIVQRISTGLSHSWPEFNSQVPYRVHRTELPLERLLSAKPGVNLGGLKYGTKTKTKQK